MKKKILRTEEAWLVLNTDTLNKSLISFEKSMYQYKVDILNL